MMLAEQRRVKILELLQEEGSARVSYLSKTFEVSEPTIRQDLEKLDAEGYIVREHGGAFFKEYSATSRQLFVAEPGEYGQKGPDRQKGGRVYSGWRCADPGLRFHGDGISQAARA